ncbi:hypothetical protein ACFVT1_36010 [Streptomyces sp. NPDC057963]|uniref:hypothetical protein n=1 Tax=Streptomyces sp. NPDC057963 TaxID=3346290 RepID=UPI0036E66B8E
MSSRSLPALVLRLVLAAALAASGYIHAQLYIDGYRSNHVIGPLFLLQAGAAFAVAALLLLAAPLLLRIAAAAIAMARSPGSPHPAPSDCSGSPNAACSPPRRRCSASSPRRSPC